MVGMMAGGMIGMTGGIAGSAMVAGVTGRVGGKSYFIFSLLESFGICKSST